MKSKTTLSLALILIGAAIYRLGYLLAPHMDADQAIFGLAGWHVLQGEFPVFQWGYHYMGTLQSYLDAIPFALFGLNRYTLNSVPLLLSLVFIFVTYLLANEFLKNKGSALVAALLTAFGPYFLVLHGAWARHGYLETMIFGSLLMLLTAKIVFGTPTFNQRKKYFLWFGLIAGLAWWTNFLCLYYFATCGLFLLWHDKKIFFKKEFFLLLGMFFIGSLPFWIYNFTHDFASITIFFKNSEVNLWSNVISFFKWKLMFVLGIRDRTPEFWKVFSILIFIFTAIWLLTRKHPKELWLPFAFLLIIIYLQSASFYGGENTQRHLLPLYSVLPIFLARAFQTLKEKSHWLGYGFVGLLLIIFFQDNSLSHPFVHTERIKRFREDMATKKKTKQTLLEKQVYGAYTYTYWLGPVATFDMGETIVFPHPFLDRYPLYTRKTDALWNPAFLTVGHNKKLEDSFQALNIDYEKFNAAPFDFYSSFNKKGNASILIDPASWKLNASDNNLETSLAADHNLRSVWMTKTKQVEGMSFTIELSRPEPINKMELYIGNALNGVAEEIKVSTSLNGKSWKETPSIAPLWGFFWDGAHPFDHGVHDRKEIALNGKPVRFIKVELTKPNRQHPHYWAFAEICLYRQTKTPLQTLKKEEIDHLSKKLNNYSNHKIYSTVWLSAHLSENQRHLDVVNIWQAPINNEVLKNRVLTFSKPTLLVVPNETAKDVEEQLTKNKISFVKEKTSSFVLFSIKRDKNKQRWYWSGKHLFNWKRTS